jgi:hypothetical protein
MPNRVQDLHSLNTYMPLAIRPSGSTPSVLQPAGDLG